jgi:TonB family protein
MTSRPGLRANAAAFLPLLCGGLAFCAPARAQDAEVLKSRALTAIRLSTLGSPTLKTFRLEGTLILFDGAGRNPQQGSFVMLRNSEQVKISATFPNASSTYLVTNGKTYAADTGSLPYFVPQLLRVVQTPVLFNGFGSAPPVTPPDLPADLIVECISTANPKDRIVHGPEPLVYEVCLDRDKDDVRVMVEDKLEFVRDDIFSFNGQRPARRVHLRLGGVVVGEAEITRLETASFDDAAFAPGEDLKLVEPAPAHLSGEVMAGRLLFHENPKYPARAKMAHIQGVVVLRAIIGTDGHISNLSVISSPDKSLSEASLKAVNRWTYEPYLLNGKPTEIDTTITVSFAMGK